MSSKYFGRRTTYTAAIAFSLAQPFVAAQGVDALLDRLRASDAAAIAKAIESVDERAAGSDEVLDELVFHLDDDRVLETNPIYTRTVGDAAFDKLRGLLPPPSEVTSRLPKLKTDGGLARAFNFVRYADRRDAEAYEHLLPYSAHEEEWVRMKAIAAMGVTAVDQRRLAAELLKLLSDPSPFVRGSVVLCLQEREVPPDSELVFRLIELLDDESTIYIGISDHAGFSRRLCGEVARLLASIGPPAEPALPRLRSMAATHFDEYAILWSKTAICAIETPPPPELLDELGAMFVEDLSDERDGGGVVEAIAALDERAAPLLVQLELAKTHRSGSVRGQLPEAFFRIDPGSAVARVLPLARDEDALVARAAIEQLSEHAASGPEVVDAYAAALARHDWVFDEPGRSAVDALRRLGGAALPAVPALRRFSESEDVADDLREETRLTIAEITAAAGR